MPVEVSRRASVFATQVLASTTAQRIVAPRPCRQYVIIRVLNIVGVVAVGGHDMLAPADGRILWPWFTPTFQIVLSENQGLYTISALGASATVALVVASSFTWDMDVW